MSKNIVSHLSVPFLCYPRVVIRTPMAPVKNGISVEIEKLLCDPVFMESIYLASPIFYKEWLKYREGHTISEKAMARIKRTVYKYYQRSVYRCTPFGLFAGCLVGNWSNDKKLTFKEDIKRYAKLDMQYLCDLTAYLVNRSDVRDYLIYFTNNSLYTMGNTFRYIECCDKHNWKNAQLSAIVKSGITEKIVELGYLGITVKNISDLVMPLGVSDEQFSSFITEILASQLLISELEPAITGKDFLVQILSVLNRIHAINDSQGLFDIICLLESVNEQLQSLYANGNTGIEVYKRILHQISELNVAYDEKKLFQVALVRETECGGISSNLQNELLKGLGVLNKFASDFYRPQPNLKRFAEKFYDQYGDREVPLLEVFDNDSGIGYPDDFGTVDSALLENLVIPEQKQTEKIYSWGKVEEFLQQKLISHYKDGNSVMNIDEHELAFMENDWNNLPPSVHMLFKVVGNENQKIYLENCGGTSAINILSRFADADEAIMHICYDVSKIEEKENAEVIFAEIVHLPESRAGNIIMHPPFRGHEIPYLSASSYTDEGKLAVKDLNVAVKQGEIVLYDSKTSKRVIPRLSNSHNYSTGTLPVYHFLCDLQKSGIKDVIAFSWGSLEKHHNFLPRVAYENIILYPATWKLSNKEFSYLLGYSRNAEAINNFLEKHKMPTKVIVADNGTELFVDFESTQSIDIFIETIRGKKNIVVKEFFQSAGIVGDNASNIYNHQMVACLINTRQVYSGTRANAEINTNISRSFQLGSEWLYLKLYCNVKTADHILTAFIKPVMDEMMEKKIISSFFFVRYQDPEFHIRLRIRILDTEYLTWAISKIMEFIVPFTSNGIVSSIQFETYQRELEKYGDIDTAELIFFQDSISVLKMMSLTSVSENDNLRWLWAMRSTDNFLESFGFSLDFKTEMIKKLKDAFIEETDAKDLIRIQLTANYRTRKEEIERIMSNGYQGQDHSLLIEILNYRQQQIQNKVNTLKGLEAVPSLALIRQVTNFIHMGINRIIVSKTRQHEMVIYDMLYLYYKGLSGKMKTNRIPIKPQSQQCLGK